MAVPAAIIGAGSLLGGALGYAGASQQAGAAEEASANQLAATQAAQEQAMQLGGVGAQAIQDYGQAAGQQLAGYGAQGIGELMQGRDLGLAQLLGYGGLAEQQLQEGYGATAGGYGSQLADILGGYRGDVGGAMAGLRGDVAPVLGLQDYAGQAANVAGRFSEQSQLGKLMADPGGYMAQDPGYQYRLQEGEKALTRAQAARGGRASGRALQELQQHAQGLASQEFGNAAQRAQATDAQTLSALQQEAGIQAGLGQMGYNAQSNLANTLAQMGMTGAGTTGTLGMQGAQTLAGLGQAGTEALASQQSGLGNALANLYSGSGSQLGSAYMGLGGNLASVLQGTGTGMANALAGAGSQASQLTQASLPAYSAGVPYAGSGFNIAGQTVGNLAQNLGMMAMLGGTGGGSVSSAPTGFVNPSISVPIGG